MQKFLLNYVNEMGLVQHNIDSFNRLVSSHGISNALANDFNREASLVITNSDDIDGIKIKLVVSGVNINKPVIASKDGDIPLFP